MGQEREAENNLHNFRALGKRNQRGGEREKVEEKKRDGRGGGEGGSYDFLRGG